MSGRFEVFVEFRKGLDPTEILDWLDENQISYFGFEYSFRYNEFNRREIQGMVVIFDSEEDATAFRLRWS